jgi:hypothetical protein
MPKRIIHRFEIDGQTVKRESATRHYRFVAVSQYTQADKDRDIEYAKRLLASAEEALADEDGLVKDAMRWIERGWADGRTLDEEIERQRQNATSSVERHRESVTEAEAKPIGTWRAEGWSKSAAGAEQAAQRAQKRYGCAVVQVHEVTDVVEREVKPRGRTTKPGRTTKKQLELLQQIAALGDEAYFGCVYGRAVPGLYRNGLVEDGDKVFIPNKSGNGGRHTHRLLITDKGRAALKGAK